MSRKKLSGLSIILWAMLYAFALSVLAVNISLRKTNYGVDIPHKTVLLTPWDSDAHLQLARLYFRSQKESSVKRELTLSSEAQKVLGWESHPTETTIESLHQESVAFRSGFVFWKTMTEQKPDYLSAYIQSSAYAYSMGDIPEGDAMFYKAKSLDPTNKEIQMLQQEKDAILPE